MAIFKKLFLMLAALMVLSGRAYCQAASPTSSPFSLIEPGRLDTTVFAGGYVSDQYGTTQEGFQFEQTLTSSLDLVARAVGYQLFIGSGFANPLTARASYRAHFVRVFRGGFIRGLNLVLTPVHEARLNFGRFEGGVAITPFEGTSVDIFGGHDAGDSDAAVFEADLSSWLLMRTRHPVNLSVNTVYNSQNHVWINEVDLRPVLVSNEKYLILAGAGGAIYAGGFVHGIAGQGGPDVGIYFPRWRLGIDTQAGYGSALQYGQLSIFKQFEWTE